MARFRDLLEIVERPARLGLERQVRQPSPIEIARRLTREKQQIAARYSLVVSALGLRRPQGIDGPGAHVADLGLAADSPLRRSSTAMILTNAAVHSPSSRAKQSRKAPRPR